MVSDETRPGQRARPPGRLQHPGGRSAPSSRRPAGVPPPAGRSTGRISDVGSRGAPEDGPPGASSSVSSTGLRAHFSKSARQKGRRTSLDASWTAASRLMARVQHELSAGAAVARASAEWSPGADPAFMEVVDGHAARVWMWRRPASRVSCNDDAGRGAFVSDRLSISQRLTIRAGARLIGPFGRSIWLPACTASVGSCSCLGSRRAGHRQEGAGPAYVRIPACTGSSPVARHADSRRSRRAGRHRLPLGRCQRRPPGDAGRTHGRGGDWRHDHWRRAHAHRPGASQAAHSRVPDWRRPLDWRMALEHHRDSTGQSHGLQLRETGLTAADYDVRLVADPGIDLASPLGPPVLPIGSRRPASFLHDASVLTNQSAPASRFQSAELLAERTVGARTVRFGGMTYRAEAPGAHRGYRADENDQGLARRGRTDSDAAGSARGRLSSSCVRHQGVERISSAS